MDALQVSIIFSEVAKKGLLMILRLKSVHAANAGAAFS
jgi:hypothetical protein